MKHILDNVSFSPSLAGLLVTVFTVKSLCGQSSSATTAVGGHQPQKLPFGSSGLQLFPDLRTVTEIAPGSGTQKKISPSLNGEVSDPAEYHWGSKCSATKVQLIRLIFNL